jgi:hypothetical protein
MKFGSVKNKVSRISVLPRLAWLKRRLASLRKCGMVLIGLVFAGFVFAQIPYEEGKVYVCPLVKSMEEINPRCDCRIDLVLGETVTSTCPVNGETYEMTLTITEHEGKEYYAILGFENGGAGVNLKPEARISGKFEGMEGENLNFSASSSSDPNGDHLTFQWDFGDGSFSQGENVSHTYSVGNYILKLTADDGMFSSIATTTINIHPRPISQTGGGVGGGEVQPLYIFIDSIIASEVGENSAKIFWLTNSPSTSRVIYSAEKEPRTFDPQSPPNYGYSHSTPENKEKTNNHSVLLENLIPNTTYYYRIISSASPEIISPEFSFKTLGQKAKEEEPKEGKLLLSPKFETERKNIEISPQIEKEEKKEGIKKEEVFEKEKIPQKESVQKESFLASLVGVFKGKISFYLLGIFTFFLFVSIFLKKIIIKKWSKISKS